jgi:DNA adenine methylase
LRSWERTSLRESLKSVVEFDPQLEPVNSPFRYAGGKFYARKLILEHIPNHDTYVEPLCGGASIFFAKPKAQRSILNDKDKDLINTLITIRDRPDELADFLDGVVASKEMHAYFKREFKPKNDLERAGRWYYLNRTSYSGIMKMENCYWGYGDKYSMRPENWRRHLLKTSLKLRGVEIYNEDFEPVINDSPDGSFLFIDPPYFNRDQDKFYTETFTESDHLRLAKVLRDNSPRLKFLLTYDNHPFIRELYGWAGNILEKEWNYTINRTDDQTKKTTTKGKRYKGKELFILNYPSLTALLSPAE